MMRYGARKENVYDATLLAAIDAAERGVIAADLGGNLVKLRLSRRGQGKSGGYRTVVAFRSHDRAFYIDGWSKNELDNIGEAYLKHLRVIGLAYLSMSEGKIAAAITSGVIREVVPPVDGERGKDEI